MAKDKKTDTAPAEGDSPEVAELKAKLAAADARNAKTQEQLDAAEASLTEMQGGRSPVAKGRKEGAYCSRCKEVHTAPDSGVLPRCPKAHTSAGA